MECPFGHFGYSNTRVHTVPREQQEAVQLAAKTVVRMQPKDTRIVHIPNTLEIIDIMVSEPLLPYVEANPSMFEVVGEPEPFDFDADGNLRPLPTHGVRGDE